MAIQGEPGPPAAVLRFGAHLRELTGGEPANNNNRRELQAAISALSAFRRPCDITLFTDSNYLRQEITEWLPRWKANACCETNKTVIRGLARRSCSRGRL